MSKSLKSALSFILSSCIIQNCHIVSTDAFDTEGLKAAFFICNGFSFCFQFFDVDIISGEVKCFLSIQQKSKILCDNLLAYCVLRW